MLDRSRIIARRLSALALAPLLAAGGVFAGPATPVAKLILVPQAYMAPAVHLAKLRAHQQQVACNFPDNTIDPLFHCYNPSQIATAYGLDTLHSEGLTGAGQTIVLVDAYGSPTAAADLQKFHDTFFAGLPSPNFNEIYPLGNPPFSSTVDSGLSGPRAAALWSGEATLDIEWSYASAPGAHIILVGVPPAETEGVQGFPTLFNAMQGLINSLPPGTVFSQSFGVTEQTFGGAATTQTAILDKVYQSGIAKGDTFLASAGDFGTTNVSKLHKETVTYPFPTVIWPTTSPYVTSAGGTQLQSGWVWTPTSNVPFNASGPNPAYFAWAPTANSTEAVWNESWAPIATGGNPSAIYPRPSWQSAQASVIRKDARGVPDLAWNSAVNGGVLTWISAYPSFNCGNTTGCWGIFGGTSAASPQLSGVVALANQLRANKGPVGYLNPRLYAIGNKAGSSTATFNGTGDFRDIVSQTYGIFTLNNNQLWQYNADGSVSPGPIAGNPTITGWDLTTGFGSPRADTLVHDLASQP